jgi:hypothetical protein
MNPEFGKAEVRDAEFKGPFFSYVWRTPDSAEAQHWGRGQNDLTGGMFAATLRQQRLYTVGLQLDDSGSVVPLNAD